MRPSVYRLGVEQEIRFLETDGGRIAYAQAGTGPPLLLACWWIGHLELQWESKAFRSWVSALGKTHTVIRYDRPGIGLSQPFDHEPDAEQEAELSATLLDTLGLGPADVLGASCGGCSSIILAATQPDRVSHLLLYGAYADGDEITTPEVRNSLAALVRAHWGLGAQTLADVFMPDADTQERDEFARYQRRVGTGEVGARLLELVYRLNASPWVERVDVPTLVLHRRGDRAIPAALGRDLAARIKGARFVSLPGRDHLPWVGDVDSVLRAIAGFLGSALTPNPVGEDGVLSEREREVLNLVALGFSDSEIAGQLVLSPHTVHRHVANVRRKLRQPSRAAAVAEASRLGIL